MTVDSILMICHLVDYMANNALGYCDLYNGVTNI